MRSKNKIIILTLISLFFLLGIGYAYLSTELNMNAKVSVKKDCSGITNLYDKMACLSVPDNIKSEFVSSNTGINFSSNSSDTNGKGIYQAVKLEGENTPIYYYRGDVKNNNVIFANSCWKIVRTTATKGVKLIYNGKIKETFSNISIIGESEYINVSNDTTYPYSYDSGTNKWISTNKTHSKTGTISFSVATEGTYILTYTVSSEANWDKAYFYKDGVELGVYSGEASGTISLGNLTPSNIIMVKYIKDGGGSNGSDEVSFSLGKASGDIIRNCDNTGADSTIGSSAFNSNYNSIAYNGYMYGDVYPVSRDGRGDIVGLGGKREYSKSSASTTNYIYSSSVTYDEATGLYALVDGENRVWNDTYSVGSGNQYLYTCLSETENTCATVNYVTQSNSSSTIYYVILTGGEVAEDTLNIEILYGNDVTYDSTTGMYTLVDTISSKIGNWGEDRTTIGNGHHYTCLNETGTCATVTYINYIGSVSTRSYGNFDYTTFSNGITVEEAVKKMTTESAHTTSSTIKTTIDTWYQNNMTGYTEKLEDTTWCNDRTVNTYGSWSKDGNAVSSYALYYKTQSESSTPKLTCRNKVDVYTVNDKVNGNGDLDYPVSLLTVDELRYAGGWYRNNNTTYYLYTGQFWWSASPYRFR